MMLASNAGFTMLVWLLHPEDLGGPSVKDLLPVLIPQKKVQTTGILIGYPMAWHISHVQWFPHGFPVKSLGFPRKWLGPK